VADADEHGVTLIMLFNSILVKPHLQPATPSMTTPHGKLALRT
jgi:hypothetical protein